MRQSLVVLLSIAMMLVTTIFAQAEVSQDSSAVTTNEAESALVDDTPTEFEMVRGNVISIGLENWKEVVMDKGLQTHLFIFFMDPECTKCRRRGATEAQKLADLIATEDSGTPGEAFGVSKYPQVARLDCHYSPMLCVSFQVQQLPYLVYIKNRVVHVYPAETDEEIDADAIFGDYLSKDQYLLSKTYSLESMIMEGERKYFEQQPHRKHAESDTFWFIPSFVSNTFNTFFRVPISAIFYHVGLDHYSKFSKVSLFCLLLLFPTILALICTLYNFLLDKIDPAPQLVPIDKRSATQQRQVAQDGSQQQMPNQGQLSQQQQQQMFNQYYEHYSQQIALQAQAAAQAQADANAQVQKEQKQQPKQEQKKKK